MSQPRRPAYPQSSDIGRRGGEKGREKEREEREERRGGEGGGPKRAKRVKGRPKRVYPADKFDFKI